MTSTAQTAQEELPANLAALHQKLQELAASTKSVARKERLVVQGPMLVIKGK